MDTKEGKTESIAEEQENGLGEIWKETEENKESKQVIIQYRIENNYGIVSGDHAQFDTVSIDLAEKKKAAAGKVSEVTAKNEDRILEWLAEHWGKLVFSSIISSAVFYNLPYAWVNEAERELYSMLKRETAEEAVEAQKNVLQQFGAKICPGVLKRRNVEEPVELICFEEEAYRENILRCLWKEFPQAREILVKWLKKYVGGWSSLMSRKAQEAFAEFAYWDYFYFTHTTVYELYRDKTIASDMLIAQTVLSLWKHEELQKTIKGMMQDWNRRNDADYLLTSILISLQLDAQDSILSEAVDRYIEQVYLGVKENHSNECLKKLYDFFGAGVRKFTFYRILTEKLHARYSSDLTIQGRRNMAALFLRLFAIDVDLANMEKGEGPIFIEVCFFNHGVAEQLKQLWKTAWECRAYREVFYQLLGIYAAGLKEEERSRKINAFVRTALFDCVKEVQCDVAAKIEARCRRYLR